MTLRVPTDEALALAVAVHEAATGLSEPDEAVEAAAQALRQLPPEERLLVLRLTGLQRLALAVQAQREFNSYQAYLDECAKRCRCADGLCGGVLAGGFCDSAFSEGAP